MQRGRGSGDRSQLHADAGTVFGEAAGTYKSDQPMAEPRIALTVEHYNRIARLLEKKVPVKLELEVRTTGEGATGEGLNIIANIPGATKPDEVVMIGAHFDSWIGGTGATDNGAGSAVMIEVMRILKALHLEARPDGPAGFVERRGTGHLRIARRT